MVGKNWVYYWVDGERIGEGVGGNGGMKLGLNKGGGGLLACIDTVRERSASY